MNQYNIAVVVGSISTQSINKKLALALTKLAPAAFTFTFIHIDDLPLYNHDNDGAPAPQEVRLRKEIKDSDGVLFVTPEYNRSIPGVLKNALDTASRPWGQSVWSGKPAAVIGTSTGGAGTAMAQQHLRNVLAFLDMPTMGQPEGFIQMREGMLDAQGNITNEDSRAFLQKWVDAFVAWIQRHH